MRGGCRSDWRKGSPGGKETKLEKSLESEPRLGLEKRAQERQGAGGRSLGEEGGHRRACRGLEEAQ